MIKSQSLIDLDAAILATQRAADAAEAAFRALREDALTRSNRELGLSHFFDPHRAVVTIGRNNQ